MKTIWTLFLALILSANLAIAQDSLYVYKAGDLLYKQAATGVDSITFARTVSPKIITGTVTDKNGNVYNWRKIGTQSWMTENLRVTKYRNGENISDITDGSDWTAATFGAWCDYDNLSANGTKYGHLYNWYAVNDNRKIAPVGWHVASFAEWTTLINQLGGVNLAGGKLKEIGITNWLNPNIGATDEFGFKAIPNGNRKYDAVFDYIGFTADFWSSTETTTSNAWYFRLYTSSTIIDSYSYEKSDGFAVRCVKDEVPTLTTSQISTINGNSATSGGDITYDGAVAVTARGICWGLTTNPTVHNNKTIDGASIGTYTSSITGLQFGTTYYVRSYATNSAGTAYGNEFSFTTLSLPTISTLPTTAIESVSEASGGNITTDGGTVVTARGVCWSTTVSPTISNGKTTDGLGIGAFASSILNLAPNTTYYLRAYATNSVGTAYGNELNFTTSTLVLGQSYQGGKIAYFFKQGDIGYVAGELHGIIIAPTNQIVAYPMGQILGTSSEIGMGLVNSNLGNGTWSQAVLICLDKDTGGYTDWFLPSSKEAQAMWQNRYINNLWDNVQTEYAVSDCILGGWGWELIRLKMSDGFLRQESWNGGSYFQYGSVRAVRYF